MFFFHSLFGEIFPELFFSILSNFQSSLCSLEEAFMFGSRLTFISVHFSDWFTQFYIFYYHFLCVHFVGIYPSVQFSTFCLFQGLKQVQILCIKLSSRNETFFLLKMVYAFDHGVSSNSSFHNYFHHFVKEVNYLFLSSF